MVLRIILFLIILLGLGGFCAVGWILLNPEAPAQQEAAAPTVAMVNALTAARSLPIGTVLGADDLAVLAVAANAVSATTEIDTPAARLRLNGALVQRSLAAGQPITADDVVFGGQHGALAILLQPGMRAATIAVDAASGGAGLLTPGDHVDVVLTQTHADPATPPGRKVSAELVLSNLRVIAVDQRLRQGALPDAKDATVPKTVTLETSDLQAQRLDVAGQLGRLGLIVRPATASVPPPGDAADLPAPGVVIWSADASNALGSPPPAPAPIGKTIHVFRGPSDDKEFKF
jgi:pilus assembly protein CpaB